DHLEIPGGLRVGIHVELGDLQRAGLLVGDLLQHRRHHLARTAPVGPEIHQNRCVAVQYVGLEGAVGDGDGATHRGAPIRSVSSVLGVRGCSANHRSASMAAAQPEPAAVIACRYVRSTRPPAATTPSPEAAVVRPLPSTYPSSSRSSWPRTSSERGSWPIATNTPVTAMWDSSPVTVFRNRTPVTFGSPSIAVTWVLVTKVIFSLARARSSMMREARNSSRRWIRVTLRANLVKKRASSIAESPPPTTMMS